MTEDTKILEVLVDATNAYNDHDFSKKAFAWMPFIERIKAIKRPVGDFIKIK